MLSIAGSKIKAKYSMDQSGQSWDYLHRQAKVFESRLEVFVFISLNICLSPLTIILGSEKSPELLVHSAKDQCQLPL